MKKIKKILIISGNLLKHKFTAIKLLKKFNNSNIIFENYPKYINENYTKDKTSPIIKHFKKLKLFEKIYFNKFCNKNRIYLKKKTIYEINKGKINNKKIINDIKKLNPDLIVLNATSLLSKTFIKSFKGTIINIHAGLMPYYRGAGCNVWTFYNKELEYTGVTIHFVNEKIDDGNIILQSQSNFVKNDNTHTIGCKNAKLSAKLCVDSIKFLQNNPKFKGKKISTKKNNIFFKKDFNKKIIERINYLIQNGLVKKYCLNKKKIKIIKY